jgi:hypothetical protein
VSDGVGIADRQWEFLKNFRKFQFWNKTLRKNIRNFQELGILDKRLKNIA